MINFGYFDEPGFPIALLAILAGLRLATYVAERLAGSAEAAPACTLAPEHAREGVATIPEPPATQPEPAPPPLPFTVTTAEAVNDLAAPEAATAPAGFLADAGITETEMTPGDDAPQDAGEAVRPQRFFAELLDSGIIAVVLVFFIIRPFILQAFFIPSGSMIPTLREGDKLLATKYSYRLFEPQHRDVVVFQATSRALSLVGQSDDPSHPTDYVKRVIGIPGDRIHIVADEGVFLNGELQRESYLNGKPNYDFPRLRNGELAVRDPEVRREIAKYVDQRGDLVVPPGYVFVLGDNRTQSHDSHIWGLLPRDRLLGKAVFIFWPLNRIGFIQ